MSYTRDDELDLDWFFNAADGEISVPSSFMAMVARLQLGKQVKVYATSAGAENYVERRFDACRRYERVSEALEQLSKAAQESLDEAHTHCRCPLEIVSRPRFLYKLARASRAMHGFLASMGAQRWSAKAADEWLARAETPTGGSVSIETLDALREAAWKEARASYDELMGQYAASAKELWLASEAERDVRRAKARALTRAS